MSNENPNNTPGWRNKLDGLEHLPGSTFNRDSTWDKLYGRLPGNKKSKKVLWYWMAAACLLFGVMIAILNYQKPNSQASNGETVMEQPKETNKTDATADENKVNENTNESNREIKNKIISVRNRSVQKSQSLARTRVVAKVHVDDPVTNYPEKEPLVKPLEIIKTNSTTAVLPSKKKLNVVHINELGDPVLETSDITRIADIHSFQLKFGNGEVISNSPIASKSSGLIILKTKPPSN
jgi:hypothetical protein